MKSRRTTNTISLQTPAVNLVQAISDAIASRLPARGRFSFSFPSLNRRRFVPIALLVIIVIAVIIGVGMKLINSKSPDQRVVVAGAKASMALNKDFSFPLTNDKGKEISKLKYFIETADLRDEIIVKGQRATAVKGRTFLILTIKLTNEFSKALEVNVRDYVRLSANGNMTELLAPDIHNDPVAVQAISTKYTRVGFPINDTDKNLTLIVGEISGDKQNIPLTLK